MVWIMEQVYLDILKRYWGYDGFRGVQADIVESIGAGHDTLGLMPTGAVRALRFRCRVWPSRACVWW